MKIPLFDLTHQYAELRDEILQVVDRVFSSGRVILGPEVEALEKEIAEYTGVKHAIGVSSGTDALVIAVRASGIGQGDYVITTPYTFFATASCVVRNGATPIFLDVDEESYNLDLDQVELLLSWLKDGSYRVSVEHKDLDSRIVTVGKVLNLYPGLKLEKVKAIIPVHLFGRTIDLERLQRIREEYGVKIIEDCAQSIGSEWMFSDGTVKRSGSVGDLAILSFFPTKNLGAYGDGGMILTNDDELAERCKFLRVHGARKKYFHEEVGYNARLDEVQAAILRVKLKYLDCWINKRKQIADMYQELLKDVASIIRLPNVEWRDGVRYHVYHQYVVEFESEVERDRVLQTLKSHDIGTNVYYPLPLHLQKCFENLGYTEGTLPVSERLSKTTLALPMFPELEDKEIKRVAEVLKEEKM